ncbi:MAG: zinc-ribbon domain-containing protein [Ruminococcus sp.]|nr:zinc-ribbon domain-containing protein [Ruminococcus sp.]
MFCRNCGNKLADNAKFCNLCGTAVPKPAQPAQNTAPAGQPPQAPKPQQPIPQLLRRPPQQKAEPAAPVNEPLPIQQPSPAQPNSQQPVQQPYPGAPGQEGQYQQPYIDKPTFQNAVAPGQPVPMPVAEPPKPIDRNIVIFGLCCAAVCIFLVCSVFFKGFTGKGFGAADFGTYKYLDRIAEVGKLVDKNVFSYSWEGIKADVDSAVLIISLWTHVLFEIFAVIFVISAIVRAFGKGRVSEVKMWGNLKNSALFSFLGNFISFAGVVFAVVRPRIAAKKEVFKDWWAVPNFFIYFFIGLSLATLITCSIMKRRTRAKMVNENAALNMSYHPFRI